MDLDELKTTLSCVSQKSIASRKAASFSILLIKIAAGKHCPHVDEGTQAKDVGFVAVPTNWLGELSEAGLMT